MQYLDLEVGLPNIGLKKLKNSDSHATSIESEFDKSLKN